MDLRPLSAPALLALALAAAGCKGSPRAPASGTSAARAPDTGQAATLRQAHPGFIQPGGVAAIRPVANPLAGDAQAVARGGKLFDQYNCSGCHGDAGAGNMCPTLADGRWRYGGTPAEIYQSIHDGRPFGMPAFGRLLRDEQLWQLVAYVGSLDKGTPVAPTVGRETWLPGSGGRSGKEQGGTR